MLRASSAGLSGRSDSAGILRRALHFNPRYLNPATGSDGNTGMSPTTAWLTPSKATTALAVAGNGVTHLYIDTSGAPLILDTKLAIDTNARGIVVNSATPGTKADLRAYKTLNSAVFTQPDNVTYPNVWATTDTQARSVLWERGGSNAYDLIWYTHPVGANFAAVAATLNTTAGSFWTDGTTMYFRPLTGNNPVSDGKTYVRSYVYNNGSDHAVMLNTTAILQNLMIGGTCIAGAASASDLQDGAYCVRVLAGTGQTIIRNCYLYYGGKHILGMINGTSGANVLIDTVQVEQGSAYAGVGGQTVFVSYADTSANLRHRYLNCVCNKNAGLAGSMAGQASPGQSTIYNHNAGSGIQFDSISIENCTFPGQSINNGAANVTTGGYTISGTRFGYGLFLDALIDRCYIDTRMVVPSDTSSRVLITNSIIVPTVTPTSGLAEFRAQGTLSLENCTIDMLQIASFAAYLLFRQGAVTFTFKNNIFLASAAPAVSGNDNTGPIWGLLSTDTKVFDRNVYYLGGTHQWIAYAYNDGTTTATRTLTQWKALGFDTNSLASNPLLNADYTPQAGSPARSLALTTLTDDYIGPISPRTTAGAYEYRP